MTRDTYYTAFITELVNIAPDLQADTIGADDHLQDDLELDSMDILNLVTALQDKLGINIPEDDYLQIETPAKAADYLTSRLDKLQQPK